MKFKNNTKESYTDLKEHYEHTAVLKLLDGTYRAIHIQDGCDNLDELPHLIHSSDVVSL